MEPKEYIINNFADFAKIPKEKREIFLVELLQVISAKYIVFDTYIDAGGKIEDAINGIFNQKMIWIDDGKQDIIARFIEPKQ